MTVSLRGQKPLLPVSSFHRLLRTKVKQIDPKKSGNRYTIVTEPRVIRLPRLMNPAGTGFHINDLRRLLAVLRFKFRLAGLPVQRL